MTDKAVILARGLGTRMRKQSEADRALTPEQAKIAETGVKALVPIDRPFLDYVMTALADAGYRRICLVIGPEHDALREYYGKEIQAERLSFDFAVQAEPKGTADAVAAAETFAGDDPFLVINSDNYYPLEALRGLRELSGPGLAVFDRAAMFACSNVAADRITKFAVVEQDGEGYLKRILEKPDADTVAALPEPVGVSMNCWMFDQRIFEAARMIAPSPRGEYELPDAVQTSIDKLGARYRVLTYEAPVLDLSSRDDVAGVAERLKGQEVRL
ncbi:MAG: nucleotidyltransferase family protein [Phycisphaeraceae bacterium]